MKKLIIFAVALLSLAACNKSLENETSGKQYKPGETITLSAKVNTTATRVTSDNLDDSTVKFKWQKGDKVLLFLANDALTLVKESQVFTIKDETISKDGTSADFTGAALSNMEDYWVMYCGTNADPSKVTEGNNGGNLTLDNFKNNLNLYALGYGTADGFALEYFFTTIHLKLTGAVTLGKVEYVGNGKARTTINCKDGVVLTSTPQDFLIPCMYALQTGFDLKFYDTSNNLIMTKHSNSSALYDGTGFGLFSFPELEVKASAPEGALSGTFSVSATDKVYFSKGNLYYDGSAFKFEDNQYSSATSWSTDHVSLFFWSKTASVAYASSHDDVYSADDIFFTNATATTPKSDFTVNGQAGVWRTLSGGGSGEWDYLLKSRAGVTVGSTNDARYAEVKVNDICGLLIFPDVFTWPAEVTDKPSTFNSASSTWNDVNYSTTDFAKLETAGCVFLPAAGSRYGSDPFDIGNDGPYWSSMVVSDDIDYAYYMDFTGAVLLTIQQLDRMYGASVRLVTAAQ